jgi:hypothetical protein
VSARQETPVDFWTEAWRVGEKGIAMPHSQKTISLGFTPQAFPPGVHICQIVTNNDERQTALLKFLLAGLQAGERASCFSEQVTEVMLADLLGRHGLSYPEKRDSGALTLAGTREVYFQDGRFDPDRMLNLLAQYYDESVARGFPGARVIGEMAPEVQRLEGGNRLLEYEARVSLLLRDHPVTTICQYDARLFDGATILDILKVHPLMVVRGAVVHNPFFLTPEEVLAHRD